MSRDSKRDYLLAADSSSSGAGPSDDYIAYSSGSDGSSSAVAAGRRRKYVTAAVIGAVVCVLLVAIIGYAMWRDKTGGDADGVPALADSYRLPWNVLPSWYDVSLRVDLERMEFGGRVRVGVRVVNHSMPALVLHSMLLAISNVTIHVNSGELVPAGSYKHYTYRQDELVGTQYLVIQAVDGYQFEVTDAMNVTVHFSRSLPNNTSSGLYATHYRSRDEQTVWVAATQFEPTHARRAFPCFDEPAMKAVFKVSMEVKQGLVPLSNAPQQAMPVTIDGGFQRVHFHWTKPQSTYLLAFAVTDFAYINATLHDATQQPSYPFRVWGEKGRIETYGQNLADRAFKVQEWFATYFDQPFPLAKQDQIAIPYKSGAMENYGLVTYASYGIYVDEWTTSPLYQSGVNVNAHELAHMLWGDLFTPSWWSDTWTKEGSARFWSFVGMQAIMLDVGDWQSDAQAVSGYMEAALRADASPSTVALVSPGVASPADISAHFGGPTYNKGGSLLRMIRGLLGEAGFQTACRSFLAAHRFSVALSTDLFAAFASQWADGPASEMQDVLWAWGSQRGFPLITAVEVRNASSRVWALSQRQYNLSDGTRWPVTLHYVYGTADGVQHVAAVWLNASNGFSQHVELPVDAVQYVALNYNRTAFVRVQYPLSAYGELRTALLSNQSTLSMQGRIGLLADTYHTQVDGMLDSWPTVLNTTMTLLTNENTYPVWAAGLTLLNDLWARLRFAVRNDTDGLDTFRAYVQLLASNQADRVMWDVDTHQHPDMHLNGMMQVQFGALACRFQLQPCLDIANTSYSTWAASGYSQSALPPANLRALMVGYGTWGTAEAGTWAERLFSWYLDPTASPTQPLATLYLEGAMVAAQSRDIYNLTTFIASQPASALRFTDTVPSIVARLHQLSDIAQPILVDVLVRQPGLFDSMVLPWDGQAGRGPFDSLIDVLIGGVQLQAELDSLRSTVFDSDRRNKLSAAGQAKVDAAFVMTQRNVEWVGRNWPDIKAAMKAALATRDV